MILPTWNESHLQCIHRLAALNYAEIDTDDKNHTPSSTFQNSEEISLCQDELKKCTSKCKKRLELGYPHFHALVHGNSESTIIVSNFSQKQISNKKKFLEHLSIICSIIITEQSLRTNGFQLIPTIGL